MSFQLKKIDFTLSHIAELLTMFSLFLYVFLSTFEVYFTGIIGGITKYIMVLIIAIFLIKGLFVKGLKIDVFTILLLLWFSIKVLSIFIGGINDVVRSHWVSQVGFTFFGVALLTHKFTKQETSFLILSLWLVSFLFNILTILFRDSYLVVYKSRQVLTLFGRQNDPNNCAAYSLIGVIISLYFIFFKKKYFLISIISSLVGVVAIFLSSSRGGILALGICILISVFWIKPFKWSSFFTRLGILLCLSVVGFFVLIKFLPSNILERLFADSNGGSGRIPLWTSAFKFFMGKPIFGNGWGTATYFEKRFPTAVHNTFLSMLAENGIIGFSIFVSLFVLGIIHCIKSKEYLGLLLIVGAIVCGFFFDSINKRYFWNALIFAISLNGANTFFYPNINKPFFSEVSV